MDIIVVNDFLPARSAKLLCNEASRASYTYFHRGTANKDSYHWHKSWCEHTLGISRMMPNVFINDCTLKQYYRNAHTFGIYPTKHTDVVSGFHKAYTVIYYPELNWKKTWGGGLHIYSVGESNSVLIPYVGNQLVVFDSQLQHQCEGVSPDAHMLRSAFVMKYDNNSNEAVNLKAAFPNGKVVECLDIT